MSLLDHLKNEKPVKAIRTIDIVEQFFDELFKLKVSKYSYEQLNTAFRKETGIIIKTSSFETYFKQIKIKKGLTNPEKRRNRRV
ncbi:hypothetical protein [Endozoicomonas euniceicola]|uniref:Uncharacterized protein n=1 Tax=Endozoicomonas euniceicola TaxID=1234143 RepID=A0ABY6H2V8_9GAMM|nr:hypothetical protein [Endozoicomonas euniceicola]UYM18586.1 hypothetical protein NX720_12020 [Endozoicomonas euniceicola]